MILHPQTSVLSLPNPLNFHSDPRARVRYQLGVEHSLVTQVRVSPILLILLPPPSFT
jgi:hypothetical protein